MKLKKVMALALASAMVFSMTACGGSSDDGKKEEGTEANKESDKGSDSKDVELSVSIWDANQEPGIKEILADFTEETGIKTKLSVVKWEEYWTMLEAGAQGGSLPDVFWMHSNESER